MNFIVTAPNFQEEVNILYNKTGREYIDVRMLGKGRPFVLELINSKKHTSVDLKQIEENINKLSKYISINSM